MTTAPSIPDINKDNHSDVLAAIKEVLEIREGLRGAEPGQDRFIKASELNPQTINNVTYVTAAAHKSSHQNGGSDEISVAGLSGELTDNQPPKDHASNHTGGTDDIQDATAGQKGLATAAQITKLDEIEARADVTADHETSHADVVVDGDIGSTVQCYDVNIALFRRHTLETGDSLTVGENEQKLVADVFTINGAGSIAIDGSGELIVIGV